MIDATNIKTDECFFLGFSQFDSLHTSTLNNVSSLGKTDINSPRTIAVNEDNSAIISATGRIGDIVSLPHHFSANL